MGYHRFGGPCCLHLYPEDGDSEALRRCENHKTYRHQIKLYSCMFQSSYYSLFNSSESTERFSPSSKCSGLTKLTLYTSTTTNTRSRQLRTMSYVVLSLSLSLPLSIILFSAVSRDLTTLHSTRGSINPIEATYSKNLLGEQAR
jgi:hypothetical protein